MKSTINFVPLCEEHLTLIWNWLQEPHVEEFWKESKDETKFRKKFLEKLPERGAHSFIIHIENRPIGYIQYYNAKKVGGGWWPNANDGTFGIDLFIGDPLMINKGHGSRIIQLFIENFLQDPNVLEIIIDPDPKNYRAIRAYEKVGFKQLGEIKTPNGVALLLRLEKLQNSEF